MAYYWPHVMVCRVILCSWWIEKDMLLWTNKALTKRNACYFFIGLNQVHLYNAINLNKVYTSFQILFVSIGLIYRRVSYDRSSPVVDNILCRTSSVPRAWLHTMFSFYFWHLKPCRTCCRLRNIFVEKLKKSAGKKFMRSSFSRAITCIPSIALAWVNILSK